MCIFINALGFIFAVRTTQTGATAVSPLLDCTPLSLSVLRNLYFV